MAGGDALPAAFALLRAITYHHYETVYGFRHRGVPPPAWVNGRRPAAGTGGWCSASCCSSPARCRPAFYVLAVLLAALFVTETVAEWRRFRLGQAAGLRRRGG